MVEMKGTYLGGKRCELLHSPSATKIQTDAPKDNQGQGAFFSPTDLLGVSLGSCMLTTMAIVAERDGINMDGSRFTVLKEMAASPRKIAALHLRMEMASTVPVEHRDRLMQVGHNCPVARSLHPEVAVKTEWVW